jgi:hypothetical protein
VENKDLRSTLINRKRKSQTVMAEQSQEAYDKLVKDLHDLREELHTLRREVKSDTPVSVESVLGFNKEAFLAMSPTKSLQWVTTTLAPKLKLEASKYPSYFSAIRILAMSGEMVVWTCAGFNRGSQCQSKWHVHERPNRSRDIRLHCCTLCYDALGILSEHRILDCPWLKEETWQEIRGGPIDEEEGEAGPSFDT